MVSTAREALAHHPVEAVRSLYDLENVLKVRLQFGGPQPGGLDPDGVGVTQWQVALYAAGADPFEALKFIQFVMKHKIRTGILAAMPRLCVQVVTGELEMEALPQPWELEANAVNPAPKAFAVQPPRGRRHVLAQLEKKPKETTLVDGREEEEEEEPTPHGTYVFSVFGNIYPFRALFDEREVAGCQLQVGSPGEDKKEYIRFVEFEEEGDHEGLINMVLVECLNRIPVYFINMAGKEDKVAQWILHQPSVYPGE